MKKRRTPAQMMYARNNAARDKRITKICGRYKGDWDRMSVRTKTKIERDWLRAKNLARFEDLVIEVPWLEDT